MGVEQHKAYGYRFTQSITNIDIKNNTSSTKQKSVHLHLIQGELVTWDDIEGRFESWATKNRMAAI